MWQQTIRQKILNQSTLLRQNGFSAANLEWWAEMVKPGDPDNFEGRAAAYYWGRLFEDFIASFKRGRYEGPPNHLLNYGYAILRATVARALTIAGLLPTLGYHHHNQYNAYCLADDMMEPYRPLVDEIVLEIVRTEEDYHELTKAIKTQLLQIPVRDVMIAKKRSPLMTAVQQTASSLYKCYAGEREQIKFPEM